MNDDRAPARARPARDREGRHQARHASSSRPSRPASSADVVQLEREIWELAGEEFVIGSPQQLGAILFEKLKLSRKRRGKTGYSTDARVLQAIRDEHEIIPKIERYRELSKLAQTYLDALPNWIGDDGRLHTTFEQTTAATGRLSQHQPEPPEHPDPHRDRPRDPRLLHRRARATCCSAVDYGQVELRVLAHIANEQVLRDIFAARRGRAHRDRERRLRAPARAARRRHALQGQDGQLRDRLRPLRLRPRRPPADPAGRGAGVHRPLPRALPGRRAVHEGRGRAGRAARLREHAVRPPPPDPRDPRPQLADAQASASGSRSTP